MTQLCRIATRITEAAWLERARRRTSKHLHEEVSAALVVVRLSGDRDCPPPLDPEIDAFQDLERAALGGEARAVALADVQLAATGEGHAESRSRRPWRSTLQSLAAWLASSVAGGWLRGAGRVRMSAASPASSEVASRAVAKLSPLES